MVNKYQHNLRIEDECPCLTAVWNDGRYLSCCWLRPRGSARTTPATYDVTMRRVRAIIVAVIRQRVLLNLSVRICSLGCRVRNAHAQYCQPWPAPLYSIFFIHSHKRHFFGGKKKLLNTKYVFWFSLQLLSETLLVLRRIERDMIRYTEGAKKLYTHFKRCYLRIIFRSWIE